MTHTHTHTFAVLEVSAEAYQEIRGRLEDAAGRVDFPRYLGDDDGAELLIFGTVALKALPEKSLLEVLDERTQKLDDLCRDVREMLDELKGSQLPPMILEKDRVEAGGAGRKCGDCGHLFERGDKSFEGDRCETCAKVELGRRMDQHLKRARNKTDLQAGGVEGFVSGRRP